MMKKKIIIRRLNHRGKWRYGIFFEFDINLITIARQIDGIVWSKSNKCWYTADDEKSLKQILTTFRDHADIDISEIVTARETEKKSLALKMEEEGSIKSKNHPQNNRETNATSVITGSDKGKSEEALIGQSDLTIKADANREKKNDRHWGSVKFSISEPESRLIIKFMGNYDPQWVDELISYGNVRWDPNQRHWSLPWSKLTVDSLSDYFTSKGIKVVIVKKEVSPAIKSIRNEQWHDIRSKTLPGELTKKLDVVRKHLEEKRYSIRTIETYLAHLELFFKYYNGRDPGDINEQDISLFIEDFIIRSGYSSSYQNLIISAIKMYYSVSGGRNIKTDTLERPRRSRALPKVFSKDEVMRIFSVTRNTKHKLILWIIYSCGLRRGEVINLKLTDLDKGRGVLHIRKGKGNVDRMVPIPQKLWDKIDKYITGYEPVIYLFEGQSGGKYSAESVYNVFKQSLRRAGIKKAVGVHCLRHSYATHLHESGLDIRYIQELLGHKSTRTTEIYTHVSRRSLLAIRSPLEDMDIE